VLAFTTSLFGLMTCCPKAYAVDGCHLTRLSIAVFAGADAVRSRFGSSLAITRNGPAPKSSCAASTSVVVNAHCPVTVGGDLGDRRTVLSRARQGSDLCSGR
jgi:hypothetical protein